MTWEASRVNIAEAAANITELVADIRDDQLGDPGLGVWDVRGLAGHLLRAIRGPITYLQAPEPTEQPLASAAAYYAAYLSSRDEHPEEMDDRVASRGASELAGADTAAIVDAYRTATARLAELHTVPATRLVASAFGGLAIAEYIRTRTLEIVAHGLDLAAAVGIAWRPPHDALVDVLGLLGEVAVLRGSGGTLLLELAGRAVPVSAIPVLR